MKINNSILNKYIGILLCSMLVLFACSKKDSPGNSNLEKAALISPASQAQDVGIESLNLEWQSVVSPNGASVVYDIYLDANNPPTTKVIGDLNSTIFRLPTKLDYGATYYWRVIAKDGKGGESESNVGMFSTYVQTNKDLLIGMWLLSEFIEPSGTPVQLGDCEKKSNLEFSIDGSMNIESYRGNPCAMYSNEKGEYSLTYETTLIITAAGKEEEHHILSLTQTEFKTTTMGFILTYVREP